MADEKRGVRMTHEKVEWAAFCDGCRWFQCERDEWKARAERLAGALDWIESEIGEGDGFITRSQVREVIMKARAALTAERAKGENGESDGGT